ncbi:MAG TPA: hypothetical protein DEA22_02775 [Blastocatellia bacterium]|nr:hypothetical protein [Blastocatellia bacterium]
MSISPARKAAFDILSKIESQKAYSSILLPAAAEGLSIRDKTLCYEITYGVLRKLIYLDRVTDLLSGGRRIDDAVRIAIRIGLYQLCFLDRVPKHSAINESVNLIARARKTSAKGFVNAILRRAALGIPELEFADELDRISVETSHPRWLLERWEAEFGKETADELAAANNMVPAAAFRLTARGLSAGLHEPLPAETVKSNEVDGCYLADRVNQGLRQLATRGEIYFQDEASQMAANATDLLPGESFLDACASPGGKITSIASRYTGGEHLLVAGELHAHRIKILRENCQRQGVDSVRIVRFDAETEFPFAAESFDVVLVDAPCSGTGTIRHNPEIRYFVAPKDFEELSAKQLRILSAASEIVRRGGKLIYSTCSLEPMENEGVCGKFLQSASDFKAASPKVPIRFLTRDGFCRTWPHRDHMDGFFIAAFTRGQ